MPERNLVTIARQPYFFMIAIVVAVVVAQSGCSKLRQSTFNRDMLGDTSQPKWATDLSDSASRYVTEPGSQVDLASTKDSARIVDIKENKEANSNVRLTATQPAPTIKDSTAECDHTAQCDCHKPKMEPKLPFAEPIEPPVTTAIPPTGLVSHPLTPILFDPGTRAVQTADVGFTSNSLRRNEQWSHEKTATLVSKPRSEEPVNTVAAVRTEMAKASTISPIHQPLSPRIGPTKSTVCPNCEGTACVGNCALPDRRVVSHDLKPIVESEPIVIVATTSKATIPPFADHPVNEIKPVAYEAVPTSELVEMPVETVSASFDDLSDDEWLAMFGPVNHASPIHLAADCEECLSSMSDFVPEKTYEAEAIEFTPIETDNSFMPAAHHEEVAVKIANDFVAAEEPAEISEISDDSNQWDTSSNFAPTDELVDSTSIEIGPTKVPTVEVPVPVATNVRSRGPMLYNGPSVRFEIIDNTVPWDEKLNETIETVQARIAIESEPETRNGLEVNLRLLEVLKRQMSGVEESKDALSNEEKLYWKHQLDAIALMLDSADQSGVDSDLDRHNTAIDTLAHLRKAVERLESIADLQIANGEFCTEISGFGQFQAFSTTTFRPDERMLVYCEVENFSSTQREVNLETEVRTRLRGSYAIYDQQGRAVQQSEYPIVEDVARKRRRDFYMHFPIQLKNLRSGQYKLQLLVEDLNGNKTASLEPGLAFEVK